MTPAELAEIRERAERTIGMRVSDIDRLAADEDRDALLAEVDALTAELAIGPYCRPRLGARLRSRHMAAERGGEACALVSCCCGDVTMTQQLELPAVAPMLASCGAQWGDRRCLKEPEHWGDCWARGRHWAGKKYKPARGRGAAR